LPKLAGRTFQWRQLPRRSPGTNSPISTEWKTRIMAGYNAGIRAALFPCPYDSFWGKNRDPKDVTDPGPNRLGSLRRWRAKVLDGRSDHHDLPPRRPAKRADGLPADNLRVSCIRIFFLPASLAPVLRKARLSAGPFVDMARAGGLGTRHVESKTADNETAWTSDRLRIKPGAGSVKLGSFLSFLPS